MLFSVLFLFCCELFNIFIQRFGAGHVSGAEVVILFDLTDFAVNVPSGVIHVSCVWWASCNNGESHRRAASGWVCTGLWPVRRNALGLVVAGGADELVSAFVMSLNPAHPNGFLVRDRCSANRGAAIDCWRTDRCGRVLATRGGRIGLGHAQRWPLKIIAVFSGDCERRRRYIQSKELNAKP